MLLRQIFDPNLAQYAYLIGCQKTKEALIIDPERDIDRYKTIASENGLRIVAATETHIHADFVSGLQEYAADPNINLYLSAEGGPDWLYKWPGNRPKTHFVKNGGHFLVGNIRLDVVHTPGHTPEHICFVITDLGAGANEPIALVSGDFLFVGDVGRPDLLESAAGIKNAMEPSARTLRDSLCDRLTKLDDFVQVLPAHGAGSACGKSLGAVPSSTMGYERRFNSALKLAKSDAEGFVKDILTGQPNPPLYFATMKRVNRDGIAVTGGVPKPNHLSSSDFAKAASTAGIRILDTRDNRDAFVTCSVPKSINAPLKSPFFSNSAGSYLAEQDKILLVVENAEDIELATRQLYRIGFDHVTGWITFAEAKAAGLATAEISRIQFVGFNYADAAKTGEILDVRTTAEYDKEHISNARSIPYTRLKEHLAELPKNKTYFVHCGSGMRATLAVSFLKSEGYDAVHVDGNFSERKKL